jgi:WD40 repeat protein
LIASSRNEMMTEDGPTFTPLPLPPAQTGSSPIPRPTKRFRSQPRPVTVPIGILPDMIAPYLDRNTWNHLSVTNREICKALVETDCIKPPWPTIPTKKYKAVDVTGGPPSMIQNVAVSCTGEWIAFAYQGGVGGMVRVWNSKSGKFTTLPTTTTSTTRIRTGTALAFSKSQDDTSFGTVDQILFSSNEPHLMITNRRGGGGGGGGGGLRLWDLSHTPNPSSVSLSAMNEAINGRPCRVEFVPTTIHTNRTGYNCHLACAYRQRRKSIIPGESIDDGNDDSTSLTNPSFLQSISISSLPYLKNEYHQCYSNVKNNNKNHHGIKTATPHIPLIQCLQKWTVSRPDWLHLVDFAILTKDPSPPFQHQQHSLGRHGPTTSRHGGGGGYMVATLHQSAATMFGTEFCLWDNDDQRLSPNDATTTTRRESRVAILRTPAATQEIPSYRAYALSPPSPTIPTTIWERPSTSTGTLTSTCQRLFATVSREDYRIVQLWLMPATSRRTFGIGNDSSNSSSNTYHHQQQQQRQPDLLIRAAHNVNCVVFSANGKTLAIGCDNGTVELWTLGRSNERDTSTTAGVAPRLCRTLVGDHGIQRLAFIETGNHHPNQSTDQSQPRTLFSVDFLGNMQFWNVAGCGCGSNDGS